MEVPAIKYRDAKHIGLTLISNKICREKRVTIKLAASIRLFTLQGMNFVPDECEMFDSSGWETNGYSGISIMMTSRISSR